MNCAGSKAIIVVVAGDPEVRLELGVAVLLACGVVVVGGGGGTRSDSSGGGGAGGPDGGVRVGAASQDGGLGLGLWDGHVPAR